jgi:hypothetical protein
MTRLGARAGAVNVKSHASHTVRLSSFESELESAVGGMKSNRRVVNTVEEMRFSNSEQPVIKCDNEAMIEFVKSNSGGNGVKHMEKGMWYIRELYKRGYVKMEYMPGKEIPADKLTKPSERTEFEIFRYDIMGLALLYNEVLS